MKLNGEEITCEELIAKVKDLKMQGYEVFAEYYKDISYLYIYAYRVGGDTGFSLINVNNEMISSLINVIDNFKTCRKNR